MNAVAPAGSAPASGAGGFERQLAVRAGAEPQRDLVEGSALDDPHPRGGQPGEERPEVGEPRGRHGRAEEPDGAPAGDGAEHGPEGLHAHGRERGELAAGRRDADGGERAQRSAERREGRRHAEPLRPRASGVRRRDHHPGQQRGHAGDRGGSPRPGCRSVGARALVIARASVAARPKSKNGPGAVRPTRPGLVQRPLTSVSPARKRSRLASLSGETARRASGTIPDRPAPTSPRALVLNEAPGAERPARHAFCDGQRFPASGLEPLVLCMVPIPPPACRHPRPRWQRQPALGVFDCGPASERAPTG